MLSSLGNWSLLLGKVYAVCVPFLRYHLEKNPANAVSKLVVEIFSGIADALRLPPEEAEREMRKELALALYARKMLPLGKARQLAGLTRWAFEELLGERRIVRAYTEKDLDADLKYPFSFTSP